MNIIRNKSLLNNRNVIIDKLNRFSLPGGAQINDLSGLVVDKAKNAHIWDINGKRYLDFYTGVGVCNIGHSHPRFLELLDKQMSKFSVGTFNTKVKAELYETIAELLPSTLRQIHMYSSGSEAIESAVRFAKDSTGKDEIISFWGGFHGKTQGAIGLHAGPRKKSLGKTLSSNHHVPYAYCYRCPLNLKFPNCNFQCVEFAENSIKSSTTNNIAALVVEPAQGTNGNIVPPKGYLKKLKSLAEKLGALLIVDEVITGFGRTGTFFAFEQEDIVPDILVLGKAMGSGIPTSAIVSNTSLIQDKPFSEPSAASSTYGGNPLSCAAASATIKILKEDNLIEKCITLSKMAEKIITLWPSNIPVVGNIGISGLMIGIELVVPETKNPLPGNLTESLFLSLMNKGLLAMAYGSRIRLYPPLSIKETDLKEGLYILQKELELLSEKLVN